ncbi:uncharacterized protein LOC123505122 [Portunus trituberculatus]|uniref:uncharacterized protein LOC123505122 n=1 Tax=Portunus trituberculatus TaxID=210409 RepID=UPI001E1CFD01|nr:uncharacterized protein LOC123505122 [Portunus trituberculatus]
MFGSTMYAVSVMAMAVLVMASADVGDRVTATSISYQDMVTAVAKNAGARSTIYLFPGTQTVTTLKVQQTIQTTYTSCLSTEPGLPTCTDSANARYLVATTLSFQPSKRAVDLQAIPQETKPSKIDTIFGENKREFLSFIPVVLPVRYETVTLSSIKYTATTKHPSVTATVHISNCIPPALPFEAEECPPSDPVADYTTDPTTDLTTDPMTDPTTTNPGTTSLN